MVGNFNRDQDQVNIWIIGNILWGSVRLRIRTQLMKVDRLLGRLDTRICYSYYLVVRRVDK